MGKEINFNTLSEKKKKEIEEKILSKQYSFKQIANEYNVNVGNINKMAKTLGIVGCKGEKPVSAVINNIITDVDTIPEPKENVRKILDVEKIDSRGNRYSEEDRLSIATDMEEALKDGSFRKASFADSHRVSITFVTNLAKEFKIFLPDERMFTHLSEEERKERVMKCAKKKETITIEEEIVEELPDIPYVPVDDPIETVEEAKVIEEVEVKPEPEMIVVKEDETEQAVSDEELAMEEVLQNSPVSPKKEFEVEMRGELRLLHPERTTVHPICKVGLISNRHNMPIDRFIYHMLSSDDLVNFDHLYITALNFIDQNIPFVHEVATRSIDLYCTGAVMVNAAVIKACYARKVNLNLFHFNPITKKYDKQEMISCFEKTADAGDNTVYDFFRNDTRETNFSMYGLEDLSEIKPRDTFYMVRLSRYHSAWSGKVKNWETCICKSVQDAFAVYVQFSTEIINSREISHNVYASIQLSAAKYNPEGTIIFGDRISSGNFGLEKR